jgi:DNA-binding XRE family transcriptional regulator
MRRLGIRPVVNVEMPNTSRPCAIEGCPHTPVWGKYCQACRSRFSEYQLWRRQPGHAARERRQKLVRKGPDVRKVRKQLGLTQESLAQHLGISTPLISLLEQGKRQLTSALRHQLIEILAHSSAPNGLDKNPKPE